MNCAETVCTILELEFGAIPAYGYEYGNYGYKIIIFNEMSFYSLD